MNIVIPMAGRGSRFANSGYELPKPLVEIQGRPMIEWVVKSIGAAEHRHIFIVQKEHIELYKLDELLESLVNKCVIIPIDYITEGQASSILLAEPWLDDDYLLTVNCDQVVEWNFQRFLDSFSTYSREWDSIFRYDGVIPTFEDTSGNTKWSYAETRYKSIGYEDYDVVSRVEEKNPISPHATVGLYGWNRGSDFVKYAKRMIAQNKRVNNEFYAAPVYNEAIEDGKNFRIFDCKVHTTGTPEELNAFLQTLEKKHD